MSCFDIVVTRSHWPTGNEEDGDAECRQAQGGSTLDVRLENEREVERHTIEIAQGLRWSVTNQIRMEHDEPTEQIQSKEHWKENIAWDSNWIDRQSDVTRQTEHHVDRYIGLGKVTAAGGWRNIGAAARRARRRRGVAVGQVLTWLIRIEEIPSEIVLLHVLRTPFDQEVSGNRMNHADQRFHKDGKDFRSRQDDSPIIDGVVHAVKIDINPMIVEDQTGE